MQITIKYESGYTESASDVAIAHDGFFRAFPKFQNETGAVFHISQLSAKEEYQMAELLEKLSKKLVK